MWKQPADLLLLALWGGWCGWPRGGGLALSLSTLKRGLSTLVLGVRGNSTFWKMTATLGGRKEREGRRFKSVFSLSHQNHPVPLSLFVETPPKST